MQGIGGAYGGQFYGKNATNGTGVYGEGITGVYASGTANAVYGWNFVGKNYGWIGGVTEGVGGHAYGASNGVVGSNSAGNSGVLGSANGVDGVSGQGAGAGAGVSGNGYYGLYANGSYEGVYAQGTTMGLAAADSDLTSSAYLGYGSYGLYIPTGNAFIAGSLVVVGTASKTGGGSWSVYSDSRLKNVKGNYTKGLDEITALNPVYYSYKPGNALDLPSDNQYVGFVAQDVQKIIPEAVTKDSGGYLQVNNDPIIWAMVNSIKELKAENDQLKARVDALENK